MQLQKSRSFELVFMVFESPCAYSICESVAKSLALLQCQEGHEADSTPGASVAGAVCQSAPRLVAVFFSRAR